MKLQPLLDVSQSGSLSVFESRLAAFSEAIEFERFNAMVVVDKPGSKVLTSIIVGNTPSEFVATQASYEIGRRDPVLQRMKRSSVPFAYDQETYVKYGAGDLWEEQAKHGYKTGVVVALHLQDNTHFVFGVDRPQPLPNDVDAVTQLMAELQLFAVHAQDAALRLLLPPREQQRAPELTPRELEILRWTREGKSSWSVGQILSVSENTINFHLRNALRKLDSSSKHQAVLKAMSAGLL